jgi:aspartate/tyrosine/aromatic aminotransferase
VHTRDVDGDAWAVRYFVEQLILTAESDSTHPGLCIAQSFSKNFGLYGERVGASIVQTVLGSPRLRDQWQADLNTMSARIMVMRRALRQRLEELEAPGNWSHIESQIGMFSYTGLTWEHVQRLRNEFHIYLLPSGRVSICGLNEGNVDYVARAIREVVRTTM